jgi:sodium-dependent dicarboxylate transporter 2/3/5
LRDFKIMSEVGSRFEQSRKTCGMVVAPAVAALVWMRLDGSLTPAGRSVSAILAMVAVLWVTEALPLPVTGILGVVLCILFGVADAKTALAPFADPIVFLFIGSFMLARAMTLHQLDRRLALGFLSLRFIGGNTTRVLAGLGLVSILISMWVSNTATTAMMLPVTLGIVSTLNRARGKGGATSEPWPYATGVMIMIAYAASIGGIGTPVGSPPNLIGIGLIRSLAHVEISFFRWMAIAIPMLIVMGLALFFMIRGMGIADRETPGAAHDLEHYLHEEREALGRWTAGEINTLAAFVLAITLWLMPGLLSLALPKEHPWLAMCESRLPEAVAAIAAALFLFAAPLDWKQRTFTLTWEDAVQIDWGTILLFGGGLSLGTLMFKTGVAEAMGSAITGILGARSLWSITATCIGMGIIISEATSNTAAANMICPVAIALAQSAGVNPVPPALGACLGASFGFMLPVSTPPNAIVYSSRLVPLSKMIRAGVLFDILGFFIVLIGLRILCPLMGLS